MRPHEGGVQRLDWELTNKCNANCVFCPREEYLKQMPLMDMGYSDFQMALDKILDVFNPKFINFGVFGEPTLYKRLPDAIKFAVDRGLETRISTNVFCLTPKLAQQVLDVGLRNIHFSVDEIEKTRFEQLRKGMNFERCRNNVIHFWNLVKNNGYNCKIYIYPVECPENEERMYDIIHYWRQYSHSCHPSKEIPIGNHHRAKAWTQGVFRRLLFPILKRYGVTPHCYDWMVVTVNGDVVPCCYDNLHQHVFGNVFSHSMEDIWIGEKAQTFRSMVERGVFPPLCQRCHFRSYFA